MANPGRCGMVSGMASQTHTRAGFGGRAAGWLLALLAFFLFASLASCIKPVAEAGPLRFSLSWAPSLGVDFALAIDGLSLVFGMMITGIGGLIFIYSIAYMGGHPRLGLFLAELLLFMLSMLGLALADNLILLFIFWELTSVSSYLLIGFENEKPEARAAALQALLVTGAGGLALLAGFLLMGAGGGTMTISALNGSSFAHGGHGLYLPTLILICLGAFTKSAQFPFYFWLPNAMAAPTPVSAYLHSATMVKAGIYLLARLSPALGGTPEWRFLLVGAGTLTLLAGAYMAVIKTDLKQILAYSTVGALGVFTMALGIGGETAAQAAIVYIIAHAFYKGTLFMVAGIIHHETGIREAERLGGLWRAMPATAAAALLALLSKAGLPPFLTFLGKETLLKATLDSPWPWILTGGVVIVSISFVVAGAAVGLMPFYGPGKDYPKTPGRVPATFWMGPLILAAAGLAAGLGNGWMDRWIVSPAVSAVVGKQVQIHSALWHGLTPELGLSALAVLLGFGVYFIWSRRFRSAITWWNPHPPEWVYHAGLRALDAVAIRINRTLQSGYLRYYIIISVATALLVIAAPLAGVAPGEFHLERWLDGHAHEMALAVLMLLAAVMAATAPARMTAIVALGVVGYGMALFFMFFSAPDLAMTQFGIETLSVILMVLVVLRLPPQKKYSSPPSRLRDAGLAIAAGGVVTATLLLATHFPQGSALGDFFADNSYISAHGRNVVNVILVDFRAFDTFGEITVVSVAAIGVYSMIRQPARKKKADNR